jgi:hypothetical protein
MYQASSSLRRTAGSSDAVDSNSGSWKDYVHIHALSPRWFDALKGLAPKANRPDLRSDHESSRPAVSC